MKHLQSQVESNMVTPSAILYCKDQKLPNKWDSNTFLLTTLS